MVMQAGRTGLRPVSCADRFHQTASAQDAHQPFHVVGQDVSHHFGTDVLERFHLEVRRSHPRDLMYRMDARLYGGVCASIRVPIEPRLHARTSDRQWSNSDAASCRPLHSYNDMLASHPRGKDRHRPRIDEVLLAETPFGIDAGGHRLRQKDRDAGLLTGQKFLATIVPRSATALMGLEPIAACACSDM